MYPDYLIERFWSHVEIGDYHYLWVGGFNRKGYGNFNLPAKYIGRKCQTTVVAHKFSWQSVNGPVPPGYELHHGCRINACVDWEHLELLLEGDHAKLENQRRIQDGTHNFLKVNETKEMKEHRDKHSQWLGENFHSLYLPNLQGR